MCLIGRDTFLEQLSFVSLGGWWVVCQKVSHQVIIQLIHEYLILVHILGQVYQIIGLVNVILGKIKRQL